MDQDKQTILIVDDERYNISILVDILRTEYKTIIAKDGESALKRAVADHPPDLILLDVMMPEMDGYEVCRRLKADQRSRDIPVIFITAMGEADNETRGLELGAIDYITKPINPPIVKARVKNHLELQRARQRLEIQNKELIEAARLREDVEQITRHDLKNPLNAIITLPQVIEEFGNLNERQLKYLRLIEESGYRMLAMVNRSLDLFKIERGIYRFQPVPVDIIQVIKNIKRETQDIMNRKKLDLHILLHGMEAVDGDTFMAQGEELLCYSMLVNLIKNALEASPYEEQVTITLDKREMAVISLHNNRCVPEEIQHRFFEKFVTFGKKSGTGLGTYSAKLIAEAQGGLIHLHTSEEQGTTVTVQLPAAS